VAARLTLVLDDGSLTETTQLVLRACTEATPDALKHVRIRPARNNWLRAPWYRYERGGAITVGQRIWFTRKWFAPEGHGDGSIGSTWKWLQHLAHEAGHLPQAERYGLSFFGKSRYVGAFAAQYGWRAITFRSQIHDLAPLEIEADLGRWVLREAVGLDPLNDPLVIAVHHNDEAAVKAWCSQHQEKLNALKDEYRRRFLSATSRSTDRT
jgi:hypothetical protein